ncbi:hypothetical protein AB0J63_31610 [Streptosporangium canum]|uniref:hypothetical protein n=1 Tax=Streptosporangium canum TaxID=324952 RepID=UPI003434B6EE
MLRRILALGAGALLAGALTAAPAQAATVTIRTAPASTVDVVYGPVSGAGYCITHIDPQTIVALYRTTGYVCLRNSGTATPANPLSACAYHEPTRVVVGAFRHPTEALICRYVA